MSQRAPRPARRHGVWAIVAASVVLLAAALLSLPPVTAQECAPSAETAAIAQAMREHPRQQRRALTCHSTLVAVAQAKAEDFARRRYFAHTAPDGIGPNHLLRAAGFRLPDFYPADPAANNVESIAAGAASASAAWTNWMSSPGHTTHLLALESFYAEQTLYGVGHAHDPQSPYKHYWVVITAPPDR
jgi:uncharacterized protein YkwD